MNLISIIGKNLGVADVEYEWNSIEELGAIISTNSWAPGVFKERRRLIANLSKLDLLVLDVDSGCTVEAARETFATYRHIIATSRNHQKEKNGVKCDRFRVVLFLGETITDDLTFKATWGRAKKLWPFIDDACKDSSRFFYASPDVLSINRTGQTFEVNSPALPAPVTPRAVVPSDGTSPKGDLWKATLKFFLEGAEPGTRHVALRNACLNMKEQGYEAPDAIEKLSNMILIGGNWTTTVTKTDLKTIQACFDRKVKRPFSKTDSNIIVPTIVVSASELLDETFAYLGDKDKVKGEPTGIVGLDTLLGGGFRTGELTVLMAQAKTGKNTLYHHLIYKHLERGIPFGYASRELNPATEVIPNLLSIAMQKNAWHASLDDTYQNAARQALSQWQLFFAPGYGYFDIEQIETWFRALKDLGVDHFLFDHFHYALQGEDYESTARLIKGLKALTKTLDVHLSLIVQPRSLREGEQLSLATLRGGAAIGQALDNLLILERVRNEENVSKLTLEVARHKLASLGSIYLKYDKTTTAFEEVDRRLIAETPVPRVSSRPWEQHSVRG